MRKKRALMPMIVFLVFIFAMPVTFFVLPKKDYSSLEKRYLEEFPDTDIDSVLDGEFKEQFESFFADHFPMRNMWVGVNAYSNLAEGNNGAGGVYNADDGYLINEPVSEDNRIDKNLRAVTKLKQNNDDIDFTFLLVPSTGYILKDKLPFIHKEYKDDEYFNHIKTTLKNNDIQFVDLRSRFKSETQSGNQLYYRTDHHWTTLGAYTAYNQLMNTMGKTPAKKSSFKIERYPGFYGTTYSTSGFWLNMSDDIEVWKNPKNENKIKIDITEGGETKTYNSLFFPKHLEEDDKYPVFVDGNHALETITNDNVKSGSVLVIKDSFAHSMTPFLAENYHTVTMVDPRYYKAPVSALIKNGNYDEVLVICGLDNFATEREFGTIR